jgi:hypothetical protein
MDGTFLKEDDMRIFWLNGSIVLEPQSQEEREALRVVSESFACLVRNNLTPPGLAIAEDLTESTQP